MAMTVALRGITWNHVRGLGGLAATAAAYAEVRPDVRVEWTTRSLQAFADQPLDQLARRFDLLYVDHPAIGYAVEHECLVPLDGSLEPAFLQSHAADSVGRSAESYVWQGRRWALATDAAAQVAAYRADLLGGAGLEIPRTWDEVIRAADQLRRHGMAIAMPCIPVDAFCAFLAICVSLGEEPLRAADRAVSRETGREALEILRSTVARSHPSSSEWNPPGLLEHMATADDVAYCPLAFGYSNYARDGFRPHVLRAAPGPAGHDGLPRGTLGGAGLAVSSHGTAVEEAVRYAAFAADPRTQRTVYFSGGGQPGLRSAWTDDDVNEASSNFFRDTLPAMEAAYLRPRHDGFLDVQDQGGRLLHRWLTDGGAPDPVLEAIDAAHRDGARRDRASLDTGRA
jgi:multiple sugar transport system substrate-binding protein